MAFQRQRVRTFTNCYIRFILDMDRSLVFGSIANYLYFALFALGFPVAPSLKDLTKQRTITRRSIMQKVRGHT